MRKKYNPNGLFASLPDEEVNNIKEDATEKNTSEEKALPKASQSAASEHKLYTEQPVYVLSYTLLKQLIDLFRRMPRDLRFTLGKRMLDAMMDEVTNVFHAFKQVKERLAYIQQAQKQIAEVQLYLRLLSDLGIMSGKQYVSTLPLTVDITKQLRAWRDYTYRHRS